MTIVEPDTARVASAGVRQTFVLSRGHLEQLRDYVHARRVQGEYTYSQKQALQEALDLLFAGSPPLRNVQSRPDYWSSSRNVLNGPGPGRKHCKDTRQRSIRRSNCQNTSVEPASSRIRYSAWRNVSGVVPVCFLKNR